MYKSLSPTALGISGRQSELLEIALTHRFQGLEIDLADLVRKAQTSGVPAACRYLTSAKLKIGPLELPVRWQGSDADFQADLAALPLVLNVAAALAADRFVTPIRPTSEERPFHDNFKFAIERLRLVAGLLAAREMQLGLSLRAAAAERADGGYQFIYQVDPLLLLLSSVQAENVGLEVDLWNWHVGGGDIEKLRQVPREQIVSVRLADLPADADLETIAADQRLMPAEGGAVDNAQFVQLLVEKDYEGPVIVAPHPSQFLGQKREAIVTKVAAAFDTLWSAAGLPVDSAKPAPVGA